MQRVLTDGFETVSTQLPAVVTVSNEFGEPRYPKLPKIMAPAKKTVTQFGASDLGLDPSEVGASGSRLKVERLYIPETDSNVEFMEGDTPQEQAAALVQKLQADKLI